jgi:BNR repeat-like domain
VVRSVSKALAAVGILTALVAGSMWPTAAVGKGVPSAVDIGFESFEPTIGATSKGDLYFSITPDSGVAVGWDASIAKSIDGGRKWKDIGPRLDNGWSQPPETNDPYIYVDPSTDRVFTMHMAPILMCSVMSWSDDHGKTWTTNPKGCSPTAVWDHQTIVAAKPRQVETNGYPNVLHQCVNAVYAAMCATSLDGGMTWGPSVPAYETSPEPASQLCGMQHGHLTAAPNGTVYLPTSYCGDKPQVYISSDDGQSWRQSVISKKDTPFVDPTVSVDSKGNLYAAFIDEKGFLYYATSRNNGKKWSKAIPIAKGWTANMPVLVAGDPGHVAITYPGTNDLKKGYSTKGYLDGDAAALVGKVAWGANYTYSHNALSKQPKFKTVVSTGTDPIGRGRTCGRGTRCSYLIDFIEAVLGPDGRPYASFVDGCLDLCSKSPDGAQKGGTGVGLMTTLQTGPRFCKKICWRYKRARKSELDLVASYLYAHTPEARAASLEHASLSRELRSLQWEATQRRIAAVRNG